ncbi:hypothetical protein [Vibrio renipiscarius]|uniref:Uncharacterized protein n=1 Tax=Vibrio renipiscarius TaxID=1461322 RepID=A0A0C2P6W2_9VIBR|nr:hypothetical protein [Vibrio renipiscarius]KII79326.1 hypothetical protein OJ16_08765 [Vibrio renipiscarius]KII82142.1 hypothetical protein PL18_02375 [Vibrio renipiscarius]
MAVSVLFRVWRRPFLVLCCAFFIVACESMPKPMRNLGKTDVDFVMDVHVKEQKELLMELTRKMYVRNPDQLKKLDDMTIEDRMLQMFGRHDDIELPSLVFEELGGKTGIEAILLSFDESFQGDRVFAAMVGLTEMLRRSYNHQQEFFILDSLDEQALYNSARNIEVFVWRLYQRKNSQDELFLLTNHVTDGEFDTSFDRIFAKMTMIQDMMALIVADKTNRSITKVAQGVAQFVFLPIP